MKKVILIDGNNILFRSYYATAYRGTILRNSKGFPTNALYGFINMINKILKEENPSYIMVAFDKGKTFRHEKYKNYKAGRIETPEDLKLQFPAAKKICEAMGIKYFEIDNYEADDIIGTFAKEVDRNEEFIATIISSDKDLLQLISDDVVVKLLKTNDYILMDEKEFKDTYGIPPIKMIDLKALMGDPSDNIPGVKGIGEKTALTLLKKYKSLEGIYEHLPEIKGALKEKLIKEKDNAFFSKELATIYEDVPIDVNLENIKYNGISPNYNELLDDLEFYYFLKKEEKVISNEINIKDLKIIRNKEELEKIKLDDFSFYTLINGNYHNKNLIGIAIYNKENNIFVLKEALENTNIFNSNNIKYTYDLKKSLVIFKYLNIEFNKIFEDLMLQAYLLNYNIKDDLSYLMNVNSVNIDFEEQLFKDKNLTLEKEASHALLKAKYIYDNKQIFLNELESKNYLQLYKNIELPVTYVLSDMEYVGIHVSKDILNDMGKEIKNRLDEIQKSIYDLAGMEFNILSPKQLGKVLFEKMHIPYPKKIKDNNYSTSGDILNKLVDYPVVTLVLEYRTLSKLYSNYIIGLIGEIHEDGKIHTIFNQTLTRTGRLSSMEPNLQNIPIREELGRMVRKAFVPSDNSVILSSDYSQIELRVFAHMSGAKNLIDAFKSNLDIHTKTAMDIFHVDEKDVTKSMRRNAKAVNFGILYGISSFGLSEDLGINVHDAKKFIDKYLETYPGIKDYMNKLISDAYNDGYVKTLFGRTRYIEELKSTNYIIKSAGERMALNTPIQGTSADIIKKAMIEIYDKFNELGLKSKMIIQVHDELVFDCKKEELEQVKNIVKETMENTYKLDVPLKVDINYGSSWYEAK